MAPNATVEVEAFKACVATWEVDEDDDLDDLDDP